MAYPTGMLSLTLEDIDRRLLRIKAQLQNLRTSAAAGNTAATIVMDLYRTLRVERAMLVTAAGMSGLAAYAQAQKNNPQLDVAAEFTAVIAAMDNVTTWLTTNFPKDGSGYLLAQTWGPDGPVDRQFTPAETATFRTQLDGLIATIN